MSHEHNHTTVKAVGQAVTVAVRNGGTAALCLLSGVPLHALTAVARAHIGADWIKSCLSRSSEAHIQEKREAGREVVWPKTCLEIPRVLLESSARARSLPTELSKFLSATINAMFSLLRIMDCSIRQKIFLLLGPSSKMGLSLPSTIVLFQRKHVSVLGAHPSSLNVYDIPV